MLPFKLYTQHGPLLAVLALGEAQCLWRPCGSGVAAGMGVAISFNPSPPRPPQTMFPEFLPCTFHNLAFGSPYDPSSSHTQAP